MPSWPNFGSKWPVFESTSVPPSYLRCLAFHSFDAESQNSDWTFFCKILSLVHFLCRRVDTKTNHMMHNCRPGPEFKYYILAYKSWHSLKLLGSVPYKYLPVKTILSALPSSYVNLSVCWVGNSKMWSEVESTWLPSRSHEIQSVGKWEARKVWQEESG